MDIVFSTLFTGALGVTVWYVRRCLLFTRTSEEK